MTSRTMQSLVEETILDQVLAVWRKSEFWFQTGADSKAFEKGNKNVKEARLNANRMLVLGASENDGNYLLKTA